MSFASEVRDTQREMSVELVLMVWIQFIELMLDSLHYESHSSPSNPAMGLCLVSEEVSEISSSVAPPESQWKMDRLNASRKAALFEGKTFSWAIPRYHCA